MSMDLERRGITLDDLLKTFFAYHLEDMTKKESYLNRAYVALYEFTPAAETVLAHVATPNQPLLLNNSRAVLQRTYNVAYLPMIITYMVRRNQFADRPKIARSAIIALNLPQHIEVEVISVLQDNNLLDG